MINVLVFWAFTIKQDNKEGGEILQKHIYRCCGYARVSRKNDESINNQENIIREYLKNFDDIFLCEIIKDNGISGRNMEREGFSEIIKKIDKGECDCIAVKDMSRLGRNYIGVGELTEKYFLEKRVRVISVYDDYDSIYDEQDIIYAVKNIMNELYSRDISERVRMSDMIKGRRSTGYGIKRNGDGIYMEEDVREVVEKIYELHEKGYSGRKIAQYLNDMNIMSPSERRRMIKGSRHKIGKWRGEAISRILRKKEYRELMRI